MDLMLSCAAVRSLPLRQGSMAHCAGIFHCCTSLLDIAVDVDPAVGQIECLQVRDPIPFTCFCSSSYTAALRPNGSLSCTSLQICNLELMPRFCDRCVLSWSASNLPCQLPGSNCFSGVIGGAVSNASIPHGTQRQPCASQLHAAVEAVCLLLSALPGQASISRPIKRFDGSLL